MPAAYCYSATAVGSSGTGGRLVIDESQEVESSESLAPAQYPIARKIAAVININITVTPTFSLFTSFPVFSSAIFPLRFES